MLLLLGLLLWTEKEAWQMGGDDALEGFAAMRRLLSPKQRGEQEPSLTVIHIIIRKQTRTSLGTSAEEYSKRGENKIKIWHGLV